MSKVVPFTGEFVPGAQVIQEVEVTVERLRSLLETAVIDVELDDESDLYLTGGIDFRGQSRNRTRIGRLLNSSW